MRLYGYWRSSCSWRVRIALAFKARDYAYRAVHLASDGGEQHSEAYRGLNPMRVVPLLEWEEDGQVRRLSQSMAILEYLEERWPTPALLPADPFLRGRARQLAESVNSGIQPLQNLSVLQHVKESGQDEKAWARHWLSSGLLALEQAASETAGAFCVGDSPSFADVCLVPQLYNARRFGVALEGCPTLLAIDARCGELPAFQRAHPDRQPDAAPARGPGRS